MLRSSTMAPAFLIILGLLIQPCPCNAQSKSFPVIPIMTDFLIPQSMTLCGEPVPLDNQWVWEMLDRELTISAWDRAQVFMWIKRTGRYFPYLEKELSEQGMPLDLKYLPVAESSLLLHIRSPKGAIGPWQFMASTARRNGLRKDRRMDERRDFERATWAALKYLKRLRETFGSWALALAAYNCGAARLKKEIEEQKVTDYYALNLPTETERFVFRIAAIKLILENPERYGYRVPKEKIYRPVPHDAVKIRVRAPVHLTDMAAALGTRLKTLKDLNPQILGYYLPAGSYTLKTPVGAGAKVQPALNRLSRKSSASSQISGDYYIVRPGDTLTRISQKTGVSVSRLKKINHMEDSLIKVGQKLRIKP